MNIPNKFRGFYQKFSPRTRIIALITAVLLLIVAFYIFSGNDEALEVNEEATREVETINVSEYQGGALGLAAPTADGNSFVVRAESGGRINRVGRVGAVAQGAVIAEIDNAAQRAALLQAQGIYEAAVAGAEISDVGVEDAEAALTSAKQGVVDADRAALTAWNSTLFNTVDELFSNPRASNPGVRINSSGQANSLNRERTEISTALNAWQKESASLSADQSGSSLISAADQSIARIDKLASMVDVFIELLPKHKPDDVFTAEKLSQLQTSFAGARATLNAQRSALESAKTALTRAEENLNSAEIGGTGGAVSVANAQVKQALGAYQAAQAAYNKSVVRAPFKGRVTTINAKVGDFASPGMDIAIIVPFEGVETETFFTLPLSAVKYTPDGAMVFRVDENNTIQSISVTTGLVTASSIRVTGLSSSDVIVADVRGLKTGDQVKTK
jgi:multidrug resistance efflux pump